MSAVTIYNHLTLSWKPKRKQDIRFNIFASIILTVTLLISTVMLNIEVPQTNRADNTRVPDRIAQFLEAKKKPAVIKPKPKIPPKIKLKPRIKKILSTKKSKSLPLTKEMKKARNRAKTSGLLALNNELADLIDTSTLSSMVSGRTKTVSAKTTKIDTKILSSGVGVGSGGVGMKGHSMVTSTTRLSDTEIKNFRSSLLAKAKTKNVNKTTASKASTRLEEQVTITFDQNKSKLYSLYNRARRKNPMLKGKLILEITINTSGIVEYVKLLVSELNDKDLEKRIISRVKQFNFGASGSEKITVTFPIEFIPS